MYCPLYRHTVLAFDAYPPNITADAAFDAWYVYQCAALHGGIGAIPLNQHAHPTFSRDADGTPMCPKGLPMHPTFQFQHTNGYRAQRTAAERINSQAQALGIERPKVRNIHSVRNLNTLIYLVINVRVLAKAKSINKGLLQMN